MGRVRLQGPGAHKSSLVAMLFFFFSSTAVDPQSSAFKGSKGRRQRAHRNACTYPGGPSTWISFVNRHPCLYPNEIQNFRCGIPVVSISTIDPCSAAPCEFS